MINVMKDSVNPVNNLSITRKQQLNFQKKTLRRLTPFDLTEEQRIKTMVEMSEQNTAFDYITGFANRIREEVHTIPRGLAKFVKSRITKQSKKI